MHRRFWTGVAAAGVLGGCSLLTSLDGFVGGAADAPDAASGDSATEGPSSRSSEAGDGAISPATDSSVDGPQGSDGEADAVVDGGSDAGRDAGPCPQGPGPAMVLAGGVCIDSTEVRNRDYEEFLNDHLSTPDPGTPRECPQPDSGATLVPAFFQNFVAKRDVPVGDVTWCQAEAYCRWAGKRLCGGRDGGPLAPADYASNASEWYAACSDRGKRLYPYGDMPDAGACHTAETDGGGRNGHTVPVASYPGCEGSAKGLFDMSGNVTEWTALCTPAGSCALAGGGYDTSTTEATCKLLGHTYSQAERRGDTTPAFGIRCCATPIP